MVFNKVEPRPLALIIEDNYQEFLVLLEVLGNMFHM